MTDNEKAALERRIDELCAELHKSQANRDMWLVRANVTLKNLTAARTENKRLTETLQGTEREADRLTHEAAELSIENAKLRKENKELRADQAHWELGNCPNCPNVVSLQEALEQNAKLRELVSELWVSCPVHDSDCDECKHKDGRTGCELYDRMLELGVTA